MMMDDEGLTCPAAEAEEAQPTRADEHSEPTSLTTPAQTDTHCRVTVTTHLAVYKSGRNYQSL